MPFDPPRNLELEQHGAHNCRGGAREPHQIVDRYWCGTEKRDEAAALLIAGCDIGRTGRLLGWLPHLWTGVLFPGAADPDSRVRWLSLLIVLLLPAAILYPSRGFHLLEPDEGRYAQIPKEMLTHGEWVVPTLQGEPYLDKPPLM